MEFKYKMPVPNGVDLLNDDKLDKYLSSNVLVLLIVGAAWCPDTIRILTKAIPDVLSRYLLSIRFALIYAEEAKNQIIAPEVIRKYDIKRYPTIMLIKKGEVVEKLISEGDLEHQINDINELLILEEGILMPQK